MRAGSVRRELDWPAERAGVSCSVARRVVLRRVVPAVVEPEPCRSRAEALPVVVRSVAAARMVSRRPAECLRQTSRRPVPPLPPTRPWVAEPG